MSKIPTRGPLDDSVKLGIPSVTTDPESLRRATIALTRAMEELARQRGDVGRSAVRVNDLVKLGLVSPDIIHTLDPGGAVYLQRGASGFIPQPPAPAPPGEPSEPTEPAEHGHSWNDIANLPDCFDPCLHTHSWEDIRNPPPSGDFDPECCGVPIRRCPEGLGNEPFWECSDNLTQLADLDCCGIIVRDCSGDPVFTCREITVAGDPGFERLTVVNGDAQVGNPVIDLATVEQAVNGNLVAVDIDAWGRVVGNRAVVTADLPPLVESEASYQFLLADNTPYKKFVYAAGALSAINLYTDAGLTDHRYTKTFNYTGSQLTSITLTRISDSAEWYKTLTYNVDDTIDLVSSAA